MSRSERRNPSTQTVGPGSTDARGAIFQRRADDAIGSPEHLRASFVRAAAVADRAIGLWLARGSLARLPGDAEPSADDRNDLRALKAVVRASATAYARRLRADGTTPERMLVLVKGAAGHRGIPGFGTRELTEDVVRWSIEAYFDN